MSLFFIGALITTVTAAILTFPLLYHHVFLLIPGVAKYSAGDILNRYVLLTIIITIWWICSRIRLHTIKLGRPTLSRLKIAAWGIGLGGMLVVIFFLSKLFLGEGYIDANGLLRSGVIKTVLWYLLGAITVGLIEEILFRGVTLEVFLQDGRTTDFAIPLSALLFAAVHFIDFSYLANFMLGIETVDGSFWGLNNIAKFLLLVVFGVLLAYTRVRSNSLYAAIGMHAGLVFALRLFGKIFKPNPGHTSSVFLPNGIDAFIMAGILVLAFVFAYFLPSEKENTVFR